MQLPPSPDLAHVVKHFLLLESACPEHRRHCFFPDGNSGLAFHFGTPFQQENAGQTTITQPGSFIYGQVKKFRHLTSHGQIGMLIAVFQPYGAHALLNIPAHELADAVVDIREIWPAKARYLEEGIAAAGDHISRIHIVETFLRKEMGRQQLQHTAIQQGIHYIYRHHGNIAITDISQYLDINPRTLERLFREQVGIPPKQFTNIVRLQHGLKLLRDKPAVDNITGIAYECGYFDQSHFIHAFRNMAGITPRQYLLNSQPLAVNFIQLTAGN